MSRKDHYKVEISQQQQKILQGSLQCGDLETIYSGRENKNADVKAFGRTILEHLNK